MKPAELYKSPSVKTETELHVLSKYIHEISLEWIKTPKTSEVEIRYYIDECFDGERGLAMFSVWFKVKPFMVCHEAGRGNRDYYNRYVTDAQVFSDFLAYVVTLLPKEGPEAINPEQDLSQLDQFYGWPTPALYDPSLKPKFKLSGRENINILRDRELALVLVRGDAGYPAAGLCTSWHAGRFTFDVVVFSPDRHRGLAKFLVQYAMRQFNEDQEAFPSPLFVVHAVNPKMKMLLGEPFGFSVAMPPNGQGTTTWEMIPTMDDDCRVIIPQHELVRA